MNELLVLFGYPSGSAAALLDGSCPFGTDLVNLLVGFPLGVFLLVGHVRGLVAEFAGVEEVPRSCLVARAQFPVLVGGARVLGGWRILGCVSKSSASQENPSTPRVLVGMGVFGLVLGSGRD